MYNSMLVPVDGSEYSQKALQVACQLASSEDAVIHILNVPELPPAIDPLSIAAGAPTLDLSKVEIEQAGQGLINQIKNAEQSAYELIERMKSAVGSTEVEMKSIVQIGSPAKVIIDEASRLGVEAIVIGSRGMSDLTGLIVGSISRKVMHNADCTVITVH